MPAPAYSTIPYLLQVGARADQPLATDVGIGALYSVSDEGFLIEQSDGAAWGQWGPAGSGSSLPATVQGDMLYASAADTLAALEKTTSRRSLVNTGATNNPAWDGAQILIATVPLTNAEILALPTTPKTLVAAPAAGFRIKPIAVSLVTDFTAGAYTNIDASYSALAVYWLGDFTQWATVGVVDDSGASLTRLTSFLDAFATAVDLPPYVDVFSSGWAVPNVHPVNAATALALAADNDGTGDFTGGNAANTMTATVYYTVEAV